MRSPHGIVVNEMDCNISVSEFELQPYYYGIYFQINTFGKGINSLIPPAMG